MHNDLVHASEMDIRLDIFSDVEPDPLATAQLERMNAFKPDTIIAFGGGSPMDAAKIVAAL